MQPGRKGISRRGEGDVPGQGRGRTSHGQGCAPALGRYLLKHGALGVILDGKIAGMPSHYVAGKEPRYFKGPEAPVLNDLAFSEKVIFP